MNSQSEIDTEYEQGKLNVTGAQWCQASDFRMSTLVLGIHATRVQWCQASDFRVSTLVLGIWCGKKT